MIPVEGASDINPDPSPGAFRKASSEPAAGISKPYDSSTEALEEYGTEPGLDDLSEASLPDLRALVSDAPEIPGCPDKTPEIGAERAGKLSRSLGIGDSLRECPKTDVTPYRAELFEKCAEPWVLHGRQDIASFIYYGGLSSTGYAWRDFSTKIFERSGFHTEVHSMAGHDGVWEHFRDTGHRQWVDDIVAKASSVRNPIFFGYSTSSLAAIVAAAENPGLFKALVLVAPPLQLRSSKHSVALSIAEFLCSKFPSAFRWLENRCVAMRGDSNPDLTTKHSRRSPHFDAFPTPVVFSLKRLQREAIKALKKIDIPILVLQGEHDNIVAPNVPQLITSKVSSESKQHRVFPKSAHSVMLGLEKKEALREVCGWLKDECLPRVAPDAELPDFKTRLTKQAAAGHVMGTIWARFRQLGLLNELNEAEKEK